MTSRLSPTWWKDHGADSPDDAVRRLVTRLATVPPKTVTLADALGRVLAQPVTADRPSPPADVSAMDGFALRAADVTQSPIPVEGEALIGREPGPITPGAAMRIATGAPIPPGADLVIKREDVEDRTDSIIILESAAPKPGDHIRRKGENLKQGASAVEPGCLVSPTVAGALASFGYAAGTHVTVHRRVRVGVVVTGDEVVDASDTPTPFQIRDSHASALTAMLDPVPWIDLVATHHAPDVRDRLERTVADLLPRVDALFLTAGVSVGPHDLVPDVLQSLGAQTLFRGVAQRPGRPTMGALGPGGQAILGLPGNPLSVFVAARRIGAYVLAHLAGMNDDALAPTLVHIDKADDKTISNIWHRPVRLDSTAAPGAATLIGVKGSGDFPAAARSHGFIQVPPNTPAQGHFPFYPWSPT